MPAEMIDVKLRDLTEPQAPLPIIYKRMCGGFDSWF